MSIVIPPGAAFTAVLESAPAGLVGTLTAGIWATPSREILVPASTGGITQHTADDGSIYYEAARAQPADSPPTDPIAGTGYEIFWVNGPTTVTEELIVGWSGATVGAVSGSGIVQPGSAQVSKLPGAPRDLIGSVSWRFVRESDGVDVITESTDAITEHDLGDWFRHRYDRPYSAPTTEGRYRAVWRYGTVELEQVVVVAAGGPIAFASAADVVARLGRPLTTQETSDLGFLLPMGAAVIADAASKDDGWVATLNPVPQIIRLLNAELCRSCGARTASGPYWTRSPPRRGSRTGPCSSATPTTTRNATPSTRPAPTGSTSPAPTP
jgi:hypothetical protein